MLFLWMGVHNNSNHTIMPSESLLLLRSLHAWNRLPCPMHTPTPNSPFLSGMGSRPDKICFSLSFSPVGWPNSFVHRSENSRPRGNCRASAGPRRAGQVPGAIGAAEGLAARNKSLLLGTPPSPLERAWVIARGPPLKRRSYVKYAQTFLLYNSAH